MRPSAPRIPKYSLRLCLLRNLLFWNQFVEFINTVLIYRALSLDVKKIAKIVIVRDKTPQSIHIGWFKLTTKMLSSYIYI